MASGYCTPERPRKLLPTEKPTRPEAQLVSRTKDQSGESRCLVPRGLSVRYHIPWSSLPVPNLVLFSGGSGTQAPLFTKALGKSETSAGTPCASLLASAIASPAVTCRMLALLRSQPTQMHGERSAMAHATPVPSCRPAVFPDTGRHCTRRVRSINSPPCSYRSSLSHQGWGVANGQALLSGGGRKECLAIIAGRSVDGNKEP